MIAALILGLGLVLVVEGLVYALAPSLVEELLVALQSLSPTTRRLIGLIALASGVILVAVAKSLGAWPVT